MSIEASDKADLIARWIEIDPYQPAPMYARIKEYGIHVWALIGHLPSAKGKPEQVAKDYQIPVEAVEAALAYYEQHRGAIDAMLEANASYFGSK